MNPRPKPTPGMSTGMSPGINPGATQGQPTGPTPAELLAKMPRRPMSAQQQAAALEKVQQQATQRVKLGQQLFEAADARLKQHQQVLKEIQDQQQILRDQVQQDVAKSLQTYDQWMGRIDESFTKAISELNQRLDALESRFEFSRGDMERMIGKAAALLEQTQGLLADAFGDEAAAGSPLPELTGGDLYSDFDAVNGLTDDAEHDTEVLEVEIVEPGERAGSGRDVMPIDADSTREADDVFGEVLRRLRSQVDDGGHAAA